MRRSSRRRSSLGAASTIRAARRAAPPPRLPLSMTTQPNNFPNPNAWSWNAAIEQDIPRFATFTMAYVGRRGLHLQQLEQLNQLRPGRYRRIPRLQQRMLCGRTAGSRAFCRSTTRAARSTTPCSSNLNRRLSHGLLFGVAYTWSKSMDYGSDQSYQLPNYYDPRSNYGPSDFDIPNTLVVNYVWDIPYGSNFDNRLCGDAGELAALGHDAGAVR